jgi:hypothetical protein
MRWIVMALAIVGAGGSGFLGYVLRTEVEKFNMTQIRANIEKNPRVREYYKREIAANNASYFLMAGLPLGLIGSFLAVARRGILAFLVLLAAFVGPIVFLFDRLVNNSEKALLLWAAFTGGLLLAALLAFLIRPKKVIPEDERAYAGV